MIAVQHRAKKVGDLFGFGGEINALAIILHLDMAREWFIVWREEYAVVLCG